MLRDRVLTALLGIPVVVLLIYFGGIPWTAAILLIGDETPDTDRKSSDAEAESAGKKPGSRK